MANTFIYIGFVVVLLAILFLIIILQTSVDESRILATPTIPVQRGVLTSFASTTIDASVEEVFDVVLNFKDYAEWSRFSEYQWEETGEPVVGSRGTCKVR